jgi:hypothetical protein
MKGITFLRISKVLLEYASLVAMAAVFVLFAYVFKGYTTDNTNMLMLFGRGFAVAKIGLFILFGICAGINAALFIISRFPALYRYPFKITADNIEIQYHMAKIMLSVVQILVSGFFWILFMGMYMAFKNGGTFVPLNVFWFFSILAGITVALYLLLAYKFK